VEAKRKHNYKVGESFSKKLKTKVRPNSSLAYNKSPTHKSQIKSKKHVKTARKENKVSVYNALKKRTSCDRQGSYKTMGRYGNIYHLLETSARPKRISGLPILWKVKYAQ
jgi:hypothetical protein